MHRCYKVTVVLSKLQTVWRCWTLLIQRWQRNRNKLVSKKSNETNEDDDPYGINSLTVPELRKEFQERGLAHTGNKSQRVERVNAYLDESANQDDMPNKE